MEMLQRSEDSDLLCENPRQRDKRVHGSTGAAAEPHRAFEVSQLHKLALLLVLLLALSCYRSTTTASYCCSASAGKLLLVPLRTTNITFTAATVQACNCSSVPFLLVLAITLTTELTMGTDTVAACYMLLLLLMPLLCTLYCCVRIAGGLPQSCTLQRCISARQEPAV